jgi:serine/threonine protein kinase
MKSFCDDTCRQIVAREGKEQKVVNESRSPIDIPDDTREGKEQKVIVESRSPAAVKSVARPYLDERDIRSWEVWRQSHVSPAQAPTHLTMLEFGNEFGTPGVLGVSCRDWIRQRRCRLTCSNLHHLYFNISQPDARWVNPITNGYPRIKNKLLKAARLFYLKGEQWGSRKHGGGLFSYLPDNCTTFRAKNAYWRKAVQAADQSVQSNVERGLIGLLIKLCPESKRPWRKQKSSLRHKESSARSFSPLALLASSQRTRGSRQQHKAVSMSKQSNAAAIVDLTGESESPPRNVRSTKCKLQWHYRDFDPAAWHSKRRSQLRDAMFPGEKKQIDFGSLSDTNIYPVSRARMALPGHFHVDGAVLYDKADRNVNRVIKEYCSWRRQEAQATICVCAKQGQLSGCGVEGEKVDCEHQNHLDHFTRSFKNRGVREGVEVCIGAHNLGVRTANTLKAREAVGYYTGIAMTESHGSSYCAKVTQGRDYTGDAIYIDATFCRNDLAYMNYAPAGMKPNCVLEPWVTINNTVCVLIVTSRPIEAWEELLLPYRYGSANPPRQPAQGWSWFPSPTTPVLMDSQRFREAMFTANESFQKTTERTERNQKKGNIAAFPVVKVVGEATAIPKAWNDRGVVATETAMSEEKVKQAYDLLWASAKKYKKLASQRKITTIKSQLFSTTSSRQGELWDSLTALLFDDEDRTVSNNVTIAAIEAERKFALEPEEGWLEFPPIGEVVARAQMLKQCTLEVGCLRAFRTIKDMKKMAKTFRLEGNLFAYKEDIKCERSDFHFDTNAHYISRLTYMNANGSAHFAHLKKDETYQACWKKPVPKWIQDRLYENKPLTETFSWDAIYGPNVGACLPDTTTFCIKGGDLTGKEITFGQRQHCVIGLNDNRVGIFLMLGLNPEPSLDNKVYDIQWHGNGMFRSESNDRLGYCLQSELIQGQADLYFLFGGIDPFFHATQWRPSSNHKRRYMDLNYVVAVGRMRAAVDGFDSERVAQLCHGKRDSSFACDQKEVQRLVNDMALALKEVLEELRRVYGPVLLQARKAIKYSFGVMLLLRLFPELVIVMTELRKAGTQLTQLQIKANSHLEEYAWCYESLTRPGELQLSVTLNLDKPKCIKRRLRSGVNNRPATRATKQPDGKFRCLGVSGFWSDGRRVTNSRPLRGTGSEAGVHVIQLDLECGEKWVLKCVVTPAAGPLSTSNSKAVCKLRREWEVASALTCSQTESKYFMEYGPLETVLCRKSKRVGTSYVKSKDNPFRLHFFKMPYCSQKSLAHLKWVPSDNLSPKAKDNNLLDICKRLGDGLVAMHARGVYHRDIKLCNILIHEKDVVYADFDHSLKYRRGITVQEAYDFKGTPLRNLSAFVLKEDFDEAARRHSSKYHGNVDDDSYKPTESFLRTLDFFQLGLVLTNMLAVVLIPGVETEELLRQLRVCAKCSSASWGDKGKFRFQTGVEDYQSYCHERLDGLAVLTGSLQDALKAGLKRPIKCGHCKNPALKDSKPKEHATQMKKLLSELKNPTSASASFIQGLLTDRVILNPFKLPQ